MSTEKQLNLILPKGRIQGRVFDLLARIGIGISVDGRSYRPGCSDPSIAIKLLKPQNIARLVALGRHDCGFTGYDWIVEQGADVIELADLGFDPVEIVAAMPQKLAGDKNWRKKNLVIASEYQNLAEAFIEKNKLDAVFLHTHGATEALPPEDADLIIDNSATGATLRRNGLTVVETLMRSTTRFICNREAQENPWKRKRLEEMKTLIASTLLADQRVLLEMNVPPECFQQVLHILPFMRSPTVAPLHQDQGFAVKAAVPTRDVPALIPRLIEAGAMDILEYKVEKIVAPANSEASEERK